MKKPGLVTFLLFVSFSCFAQWNTITNGIHYNGNVGIGTDPTSYKLRIVSAGTNDGQFDFKAIGEEAFFRMSNGENWGFMMRSEANFPKIGAYHSGALIVHPYSSAGGNLDTSKGALATFNFANMRVGIGTTSPGAKLEVYGVDGLTNAPNTALILDYESNSTTIDGGGTAILFRGKSSGGNLPKYDQARIRSVGYDTNNSHGLAFDYKPNAATNLSEGMRLTKNGRLGIGISSPTEMLEVSGNIKSKKFFLISESRGQSSLVVRDPSYPSLSRVELSTSTSGNGSILLKAGNNSDKVVIGAGGSSYFNGGNVGIGTSTPGEKLEVNGTVRSKKVKVEANGWPDYVFAPSFELRSLTEVESFIKENRHLPEVPSAKEIEVDGLDLGAMDATLLKKVEELTLYTIDQDKRIKKQDELINDLLQRLEKLEKKN